MAKNSEKRVCFKCGQMHYCDDHHILPKGLFGDGKTEPLCKNCHYEYHRFMGFKFLRKAHKQPTEFYIDKFIEWLEKGTVVLIIGLLIKMWW